MVVKAQDKGYNDESDEVKKKSKLLYQVVLFVIAEVLLGFLLISSNPIQQMNPEWILYANIGILTFIAIFYGLVSGSYARILLKNSGFDKRIDELYTKFNEKKGSINDIKELEEEIELVKARIRNNKFLKRVFQIDIYLYAAVTLFIFGIISQAIYHLTALPVICLKIGTILVLHIITIWGFYLSKD